MMKVKPYYFMLCEESFFFSLSYLQLIETWCFTWNPDPELDII